MAITLEKNNKPLNLESEIRLYIESRKSKRKESFIRDFLAMIELYNSEESTALSYNGRQILELLQNCDDQASPKSSVRNCKKAIIKVDYKKRTVSIFNDGDVPFSKAGYDSLIYSGISSKNNKKQYIGNKGLGLRSLRACSEHFWIKSNGIKLSYSHNTVEAAYKEILAAQSPENQVELEKQAQGKHPVPFFSCPSIDTYYDDTFTTEVGFCFKKDVAESIREQIDSISAETLLFLSHLESIEIDEVGKAPIVYTCKRKRSVTKNSISEAKYILNGNQEWRIFGVEGTAPKELVPQDNKNSNYYQVKIAYRDGHVLDRHVNCFFPTDVPFCAPYLVHATFELDPNRKHLETNNKMNLFIAKELARLITQAALIIKVGKKATWNPVKMVHFDQGKRSEELDRLKLFSYLDDNLEKMELYPCVDNRYRTRKKVFFYNNEFSHLISNRDTVSGFKDFLIANGGELVPEDAMRANMDMEGRIHRIAKNISTISLRAKLVKVLSDYKFEGNFNEILIDEQGTLIKKDNTVFSPSGKHSIEVPSFCNITFLNKVLFNYLLEEFNVSGTGKNRSRDLKPYLEKHFNFENYEIRTVIDAIIESCNNCNTRKKAREHIVQAVKNLYSYYRAGQFTDKTEIRMINLISRDGKIVAADKLCFSKDYSCGIITEDIFSAAYGHSNYLADRKIYLLDKEDDITNVESFFKTLGVNVFCKHRKTVSSYSNGEFQEYFNTFSITGKIQRWTGFAFIEDIKHILENITREQILLWICKDRDLSNSLGVKNYVRYLRPSYVRPTDSSPLPSYISHCFSTAGFNYSGYVLEEQYYKLNENPVRYDDPLFRKHHLDKREIENALILLGAKSEFKDLCDSDKAKILDRFSNVWTKGETTQSLYKKICHDLVDKSSLASYEFRVFAKKGRDMVFENHNNVWFSDKNELPLKIRDQYCIFNYPKRQKGEDAIRLFGLKNLADIDIEIDNEQCERSPLNEKFSEWIDKMKPYILAIRLNEINDEKVIQRQVSLIDNLSIVLDANIQVKINGEESELGECEYVKATFNNETTDDDDQELFHIKYSGSDGTFHKQINLVGCIAEILSSRFNLVDDSVFELIMSKSPQEARQWTISKYGEDAFAESMDLLKRKENAKEDFVGAICKACGFSFKDTKFYNGEIPIADLSEWTIDYQNINDFTQRDTIKQLFEILGCNIEAYNMHAFYKICYLNLFTSQAQTYFENREPEFERALQATLTTTESRRQYLDYISSYNKYFSLNNPFQEYLHSFEIPLETIWISAAKMIAGSTFDVNQSPKEFIDDDKWRRIVSTFTLEEQELIMSSVEMRSMIYFPEEINSLRDELKNRLATIHLLNNSEPEPDEAKRYEIIETDYDSFSPEKMTLVPENAWTPSHSSEEQEKSRKGNRVQDDVFRELIRRFGVENVRYKAIKDEGLHYDIKYRTEKSEDWRYIDVKYFSGISFEMSESERKFAEENWNRYEIWLCNPHKSIIEPITNIYDEDGNTRLDLSNKSISYKIYLKKKDS